VQRAQGGTGPSPTALASLPSPVSLLGSEPLPPCRKRHLEPGPPQQDAAPSLGLGVPRYPDSGTGRPSGWRSAGPGTHLSGDASAGAAARAVPLALRQGEAVAGAQPGLEEERGPAAADPALRDDGDAVPQQLRLVHVVGGQDDGAAWGQAAGWTPDPLADPPPVSLRARGPCSRSSGAGGLRQAERAVGTPALTFAVLEQQLPDAAAGVGVDAGRGLVQDDHPGAAHEGDGHRELPLHPACRAAGTALGGPGAADPHSGNDPGPPRPRTREGPGLLAALVGQPHVLDQLLHLGRHPLRREPLQPPVEPDVLLHRQAAGRGRWAWGVQEGSPAHASPPTPLPGRPCPRLRVEEHVVLGTRPHGLADAVDVGADVPAQDVGSAGGGGQQAREDGPGGGTGGERGSQGAEPGGPHPT